MEKDGSLAGTPNLDAKVFPFPSCPREALERFHQAVAPMLENDSDTESSVHSNLYNVADDESPPRSPLRAFAASGLSNFSHEEPEKLQQRVDALLLTQSDEIEHLQNQLDKASRDAEEMHAEQESLRSELEKFQKEATIKRKSFVQAAQKEKELRLELQRLAADGHKSDSDDIERRLEDQQKEILQLTTQCQGANDLAEELQARCQRLQDAEMQVAKKLTEQTAKYKQARAMAREKDKEHDQERGLMMQQFQVEFKDSFQAELQQELKDHVRRSSAAELTVREQCQAELQERDMRCERFLEACASGAEKLSDSCVREVSALEQHLMEQSLCSEEAVAASEAAQERDKRLRIELHDFSEASQRKHAAMQQELDAANAQAQSSRDRSTQLQAELADARGQILLLKSTAEHRSTVLEARLAMREAQLERVRSFADSVRRDTRQPNSPSLGSPQLGSPQGSSQQLDALSALRSMEAGHIPVQVRVPDAPVAGNLLTRTNSASREEPQKHLRDMSTGNGYAKLSR